jgi:DNA polymerase-1
MSKILIADGFNLLMRGFYALPPLANASGVYTNAVFGFLNIFLRFIDEEQPDYAVVAFDLPKPTFRHERYEAYKGTRTAMPEELRPQIPLLRGLLEKMSVCQADCEGYEADDVIGSLASKAEANGYDVVIVSGDKDLLQLASERTQIRVPKTKAGKTEVENYNAADVMERIGVTPREYIDVKALMGDASDNIPGVPGIGEVTATKIIASYGSVENAIEHYEEIKPKRASENLNQYREQALLSKELATICIEAPLTLSPEDAVIGDMWNAEARAEFLRLELKTFYKRFEKEETTTEPEVTLLTTVGDVTGFVQDVNPFEPIAFYLLADGDELSGIAFACEAQAEPEPHDITAQTEPTNPAIYYVPSALLHILLPWFESGAPKLAMDSKRERQLLRKHGITLNGIVFDAVLAAYVAVRPGMDERSVAGWLNESLPPLTELLDNKGKKGASRKHLADLSAEAAAAYAGKAARLIYKAYPLLMKELHEQNQTELYNEIELPLAALLAEMENTGVKADSEYLINFGSQLDAQISQLAGLIYQQAGEEFNILSPSQLGVILFEKLQLKGTKKTKTGWSTDAGVLEKLAGKHPIVPLILEYRTYTKLKSTYVDGLLPLIDAGTSRIHTTFHQALTATGRLSSAEPNLQNIPIRTELGRQMRKVFVADDGCVLVDADYSQIELRVLAHMSQDEQLIRAYNENTDIHRLTASQVFHVKPTDVTPEQRSSAKAVNFGIIYGISAFGLSDGLQIGKKEAERYIEGYFETYPGVKQYMDKVVADATTNGYAETLFKRRRLMPELKSSNYNQRSFGERAAMNMPIQGTAADIIKLAMLRVDERLKRENLKTRIVLQIHDELLLEAPIDEAEIAVALVHEEMENAAKLSVPLLADVHTGLNWYDAK